jgi:hypothetical protein
MRRLVVALTLVALAVPAAALADGDPASDWLPFRNNYVFAPGAGNIPPADVKRLQTVLLAARRQRFTTKVALIGVRDDLGAVTALWRKPQVYAQFLGKELFYLYKGRLLVVMPNGFGVSTQGGRPVPAEEALLRKIAVPANGLDNLPDAAIGALQKLATAGNISLPVPAATQAKKKDTSTRDRITIAIAVVVAAAVVFAARFIRRPR